MAGIATVEPSDAGCWIGGHWGQYAAPRLCEIAQAHGWEIDAESKAYIDNYSNGSAEDSEIVYELADKAEEWMNRHVAPKGYSFGWQDGEFYLWSIGDWEVAW